MNGFFQRTLRTARRTDLSFGLLVLRVGIAFTLILGHGYYKLTNFDAMSAHFPDPIGIGSVASLVLATFAEFFCSILVGLGLFTRLAAIPLIINMSVATFLVNAGGEFSGMEKSLMYLIVFAAIFFTGGGRFSLDAAMSKQ